MRTNSGIGSDMVTLARLHAALDSVVETEVLIATIHETSTGHAQNVTRLAEVVREAKDLLRSMLSRPDQRQLSET